jgi:hypothetical protein
MDDDLDIENVDNLFKLVGYTIYYTSLTIAHVSKFCYDSVTPNIIYIQNNTDEIVNVTFDYLKSNGIRRIYKKFDIDINAHQSIYKYINGPTISKLKFRKNPKIIIKLHNGNIFHVDLSNSKLKNYNQLFLTITYDGVLYRNRVFINKHLQLPR